MSQNTVNIIQREVFPQRCKSTHISLALREQFSTEEDPASYLQEVLSKPCPDPLILYLHVPFCKKICSFCPFFSYDGVPKAQYHERLIAEIESLASYPFSRVPLRSVYLGGGTPTALEPEQMAAVLQAIQENFTLAADLEICSETSCTELTDEMLEVLIAGGVNRLSIGVQSFQEEGRRLLGRRGSAEAAKQRIRRALELGIDNTNVDLIYRYPGQSLADLEKDIETVVDLGLAGISFYPLSVFPKTPLGDYLLAHPEALAEVEDLEREHLFFMTIYNRLYQEDFRLLELTKLVHKGRDKYSYVFLKRGGGSCLAVGQAAAGSILRYSYANRPGCQNLSEELKISSMGRVYKPSFRALETAVFQVKTGKFSLRDFSFLSPTGLDILAQFCAKLMRYELLVQEQDKYLLTREGMFWGNNILETVGQIILKDFQIRP